MKNPVLALMWESWRLSRRWYLWVLPVALGLVFLIMRQAEVVALRAQPGFMSAAEAAALIAPSALMINFALAIVATLLAVSLGNKSGFPLSFEFRLPVKTSLLVAVPMLTLAMLCASLYVVPMAALRMAYGVPVPLLPAAALIAMFVAVLLACGWSTGTSGSRALAMLVGIVAASQFFALLDPVDVRGQAVLPGQRYVFNDEIIALSPGKYLALAVVVLILYALTTASIRKQRYGEMPVLQLPGATAAQPRKQGMSLSDFLGHAAERLLPACPTGAPWRAELWLELRRQILPILLLSVSIAMSVPLLYLIGMSPGEEFENADYIFPGAVFFVGIGIAVFNRRQASGGYMSAFEGTRGMSTLALAAIQVLSVAATTLCGIALVLVSVHLSSGFIDTPGELALRIQAALAAVQERSALFLAAATVTQLVNYLTLVMLLACVHTWSVVWGRWVSYGTGIVALYAAAQAIRVSSGDATLEEIKQHLWALAIVVCVLTLLASARTLYTKVLAWRVVAGALAIWALFLACSLYDMAQQERAFTVLAPEMQAYTGALLVSPLLFFVLLLWSYDRLRHR